MKIIMPLFGLLFVLSLSQKTLACDCDKGAKKDKTAAAVVADNHDSKAGDKESKDSSCGDTKSCKEGKSCKCGDKKGESCSEGSKSCKDDGKSCSCGKKHKA